MTIYGNEQQCKEHHGFYAHLSKVYPGLSENETSENNEKEKSLTTKVEDKRELNNSQINSESDFIRGNFPGFVGF